MKPKAGEKFPNFITQDLYGNTIHLNDYSDKKILLTFFRYASCPFCNLRVNEMIKKTEELESKGLKIITVFSSGKEEINSYAGSQNPTFTILPDPKLDLYKKYGIETSFTGMLLAMTRLKEILTMITKGYFNLKTMHKPPIVPADFLIDKGLIIKEAYYGKDFGDHISLEKVKEWLK